MSHDSKTCMMRELDKKVDDFRREVYELIEELLEGLEGLKNKEELEEMVEDLKREFCGLQSKVLSEFQKPKQESLEIPATAKWTVARLARVVIAHLNSAGTDLKDSAPNWTRDLFRQQEDFGFRRELVSSALQLLAEDRYTPGVYLNIADDFVDKTLSLRIQWLHLYRLGACKWVDEVIQHFRHHNFTYRDTFTLLGKAQQLEAQSVFKRVLAVLSRQCSLKPLNIKANE